MKKMLFASLLLALVATKADSGFAADPVEAGLQSCGSCHGVGAPPHDPTIPIIDGQQVGYLQKQLQEFRSGERESQVMSSMAESIRSSDLARASALIASRPWPKRANGAAASEPDAIAACRSCHGVDLGGGQSPEGVAPRLAGQSPEYLADQMGAFARGERGNGQTMMSIMQSLDAEERARLATYMGGLSN